MREELLAAQMRVELGEMSEGDFGELERDILARLREIRDAQREGGSGASSPSAPAASRSTSPSGATRDRLTGSLPPSRLFGGKGGVGKTTCAAAAALAAAEAGRRVLAVSTDPAPSLGDALRTRLTGEPSRIATRRGVLLAAELAAGPALGRWQREHRESLREIAARGTYLDTGDVDRFLALALPGADELIAWIELARLVRLVQETAACDEVVVDAAPTAHTLRLLAMPEALRRFAGVLDHLQERHRWMAESFGHGYRPDASDALVAGLEAQGAEIEERLRDPARCRLTWVMLPEALSLAETRDALASLDAAGIPVREVIVNRVLPPAGEDCPLCRERRRAEAAVIGEIRAAFAERELRSLPEEAVEPRGKTALRRLARQLAAPLPEPSLPGPVSRPARRGQEGGKREKTGELNWLDDLAPPGVQLLFFGGKGGVGRRPARRPWRWRWPAGGRRPGSSCSRPTRPTRWPTSWRRRSGTTSGPWPALPRVAGAGAGRRPRLR